MRTKVLVTSGGTSIPIDRVRKITNMSNGTFGAKIATELLKKEFQVDFLRAEKSKSPFSMQADMWDNALIDGNPAFENGIAELVRVHDLWKRYGDNYTEIRYKTFDDYSERLVDILTNCEPPNIIFLAAAVSDYGTIPLDGKIRSKDSEMVIQLHALPKLIGKVKELAPNSFLVGFKLLVDSTPEQLITAARESIEKNGCDLVVANDFTDLQKGDHKVYLVDRTSSSLIHNRQNDPNSIAKQVVASAIIRYYEDQQDLT